MPGKGFPKISFRVSYAQYTTIHELAKKEGKTISAFIRSCIQLYLLSAYKK